MQTQSEQSAYSQQNVHSPQNGYHQQEPLSIAPQAPPEPTALTPEQSQQNQHAQRFARILQLPMFPLYTGAEAAKRQQELQNHLQFQADMAKEKAKYQASRPQLSATDKIVNQAVGAATGATLFSIDGAINKVMTGLAALDALQFASGQKPTEVLIIVRWASPPGAQYPPIVVDVLEIRGIGQEKNGAMCLIKGNRDFKVKVGTKYEKKIKKSGKWRKTIYGSTAVSIIEKGVGEFPLEVVQSTHMPMLVADWIDVMNRFKKQWVVPG